MPLFVLSACMPYGCGVGRWKQHGIDLTSARALVTVFNAESEEEESACQLRTHKRARLGEHSTTPAKQPAAQPAPCTPGASENSLLTELHAARLARRLAAQPTGPAPAAVQAAFPGSCSGSACVAGRPMHTAPVSILSWNVWGMRAQDGPVDSTIGVRMAAIGQEIAGHQPDFICLQVGWGGSEGS